MIGEDFHTKITSKQQLENDKTEWNFMKLTVNSKHVVESDEACCSKDSPVTAEWVYHLSWALFKQLKGWIY